MLLDQEGPSSTGVPLAISAFWIRSSVLAISVPQ
jgi:hypothetical protein